MRIVSPAPDLVAELALIEMSKLQRHTGVLLSAGVGALGLASAYLSELTRRDIEAERKAA